MESKKKLIIILLISILLVGVFVYFIATNSPQEEPVEETPELVVQDKYDIESFEIIGRSIENRELRAFNFGQGDRTLVFVGALHGGYEWNTALLSYEIIDWLMDNPDVTPSNLEIIVIPVANPDGLHKVMGTSGRFYAGDAPQFDYADEISFSDDFITGRFNQNEVDLNRNFDCNWQPEAIWRDYGVSGGENAFSEPETRALRDYLVRKSPEAVVFFHSASNGVYTSFCGGDALEGTDELLDVYSEASGYPRYDDFPYYEVTGDAGDWLSTVNIPAVTVELSTHKAIEWEKNKAAIEAMFELYSNK